MITITARVESSENVEETRVFGFQHFIGPIQLFVRLTDSACTGFKSYLDRHEDLPAPPVLAPADDPRRPRPVDSPHTYPNLQPSALPPLLLFFRSRGERLGSGQTYRTRA